jgi:hypothetical protein
MCEWFKNWNVLEIWGHHHSMLMKISNKGITTPMTHAFHSLKGYPSQQILKGTINPDTMAFQRSNAKPRGSMIEGA